MTQRESQVIRGDRVDHKEWREKGGRKVKARAKVLTSISGVSEPALVANQQLVTYRRGINVQRSFSVIHPNHSNSSG